MSVDLVKDADKKVGKLVSKKAIQSVYKNAQDDVVKCMPIKFVDDLNRLVVEVALMISEVADSEKFADDDFPSAIKYLCKKLLKEKALLSDFESYVSNVDADREKSLEEIDGEGIIYGGANLYNSLIDLLAQKLQIASLTEIFITAQIDTSKKEKQEKKMEKKDKKTEAVEEPKKQDKNADAVEQPKKQDKKTEVVEQPKKTNSHDKARSVYVDEGVGTLAVELMRGDGWYEKGLAKKDFFQCVFEINFEGNGKYELKGAQIVIDSFKVKNTEIKELIRGDIIAVKPGRNDLDIEIDRQGLRKFLEESSCDNINRLSTELNLSVTATVKSGLKAKKLPCDVSCVF